MRWWRMLLVVGLAGALAGCSAIGRMAAGSSVRNALEDAREQAGVPMHELGPITLPDGTLLALWGYRKGNESMAGYAYANEKGGGGGSGGGSYEAITFGWGSLDSNTLIHGWVDNPQAVSVRIRIDGQPDVTVPLQNGLFYVITPLSGDNLMPKLEALDARGQTVEKSGE